MFDRTESSVMLFAFIVKLDRSLVLLSFISVLVELHIAIGYKLTTK